ncbi:hypothetical protein niasHT_007216 [Heterodera trifolii]|uniref:Ig-like domain-containing protein n=1 Tax=Heterodera trifolii TaxID=157864 RepID=A0ABD2LLD6_9BILA
MSLSLCAAPFFLFALSSASPPFLATSNGCPQLIDGQLLDFVNPGGIRLTKSKTGNCDRLISCDLIGAPVELTKVEWYVNGRKIERTNDGTEMEETTENAQSENERTGRSAIGVGEVSHRLCADNWLVDGPSLNGNGMEMEFRCAASLDCGEQNIESEPLLFVGTAGRRRRTANGVDFVSSANNRFSRPPLISMITSSRMELTGLPLRIACAADGFPKPLISWEVVGVDGIELKRPRPAGQFPFITERHNGQLLINSNSSALRDVASISLRCSANNRNGADSAKSLVVLLNDARK